jgi:iron-sulfur cluster assembly accessory protein
MSETLAPLPTAPTLTATAARRIQALTSDGSNGALRLRVDGGGCSGFQYTFDLVPGAEPGDTVIERDGARLVVDDVSLPFVAGAELDFVDDLMGASFRVKNPNATASCGCGTSFSI